MLLMYAPFDDTPPITRKGLLAGQHVADIKGNVGATRDADRPTVAIRAGQMYAAARRRSCKWESRVEEIWIRRCP